MMNRIGDAGVQALAKSEQLLRYRELVRIGEFCPDLGPRSLPRVFRQAIFRREFEQFIRKRHRFAPRRIRDGRVQSFRQVATVVRLAALVARI